MGPQIHEINNNIIDMETLKKNIMSFKPLYLQDLDTLIIQIEPAIPSISIDFDGDLFLRVDPKNKEIVGIEIEDFEGYFIVKYPAFGPLWKGIKNYIKRNNCENKKLTAFLAIIRELINDLINKHGNFKLTTQFDGQPALF